MSETQQTTLKKQLSSRHITMLALGGAIGAGLFKGSGEAIGIAGPSVLIAFLIGGAVLFIVMSGLGKLVLDGGDTHHGLSGLVRPFLGAHSADLLIGFIIPCGQLILSQKRLPQLPFYNFGFLIFLLGFLFSF